MRFSSIIRRIILDLADNREKRYSPKGRHIGPNGGRFDYLDEIENKFRQVGHVKGDSVSRSRVIGKHVPGDRYVHRNYIPESEKGRIEELRKCIPADFDPTIIMMSKDGSVSFINSPDFDTSDEPITGDSYKVTPDGKISHVKMSKDPKIYHHKWQMVGNDYQEFDVGASKQRSQFWTEHPHFKALQEQDPKISSKIGNKSKWDEINKGMVSENKSVFHTTVTDPNYHPEKTSINSRNLPKGMRYALDENLIPDGALVIDYGGGKYDNGKAEVESRVSGSSMHILDPYSRTKEHNDAVMALIDQRKADVVMNHNVLNVIQDPSEREKVIQGAFSLVKPGGQLHISVYEKLGNGVGEKVITNKKTGEWNWQENRKTKDYIPEIQEALPEAKIERKGNLIIVHKE